MEKTDNKQKELRPVVYATDPTGKEIKFPIKGNPGRRVSKHTGSKKGSKPAKKQKWFGKAPIKEMTNHERVMAGRAKKLGMPLETYQIIAKAIRQENKK